MEVTQVLHMNGGTGDTSYSSNSLLQRKVISMTKPILEQALTNLYRAMNSPKTLVMADLGCSSGPNTLMVASELIITLHKIKLNLGDRQSSEIQIYLNDLPQNDFNTIFLSLSNFHKSLVSDSSTMACYFTGVPGSFYTRLVLRKTVHFVHSSYSLMWLSQVPKVGETNKQNIYMSSRSPPSVIKAYHEQFQRDFSVFLKCRAEELVDRGRMVLTILGRRNEDPCSKECCYIWELLAMALNDMVSEGLIEEREVDSFNIPQYSPCAREIDHEIEKEGSFTVDRLEVSEVEWDAYEENNPNFSNDNDERGYNVVKCMRAVAEPLLASHFKESIIEEVFRRYRTIITDRMSKEKTEFINVTVSMTRKG